MKSKVIKSCNKGYYANTDSFHLWCNILVHKIYTFPFSSLSLHRDQIYTRLPGPKKEQGKEIISHS